MTYADAKKMAEAIKATGKQPHGELRELLIDLMLNQQA